MAYSQSHSSMLPAQILPLPLLALKAWILKELVEETRAVDDSLSHLSPVPSLYFPLPILSSFPLLSLLPVLYFSIILNYVCADVIKGQKHKIPLEMRLPLIMSHQTWILGSEFRSFIKATCSLNPHPSHLSNTFVFVFMSGPFIVAHKWPGTYYIGTVALNFHQCASIPNAGTMGICHHT